MMFGLFLFGSSKGEMIRGDAWQDYIDGRGGDDELYSGAGNDTVHGGTGDDWIYNDKGDDELYGDGGNDTISFLYWKSGPKYSDISLNTGPVIFDLAKAVQTVTNFGTDTYSGFENVDGSQGKNTIWGDARGNVISGGDSADKLFGRAGNDTIRGGAGSDIIKGGKGADKLGGFGTDGGGIDYGRDSFRYDSMVDGGTAVGDRDMIWGSFDGDLNSDQIDLHRIDANGSFGSGNGTFKFIGSKDFKAGTIGEVQVKKLANGDFRVALDTDKDNSAEMVIIVHSSTGKLVEADFFL